MNTDNPNNAVDLARTPTISILDRGDAPNRAALLVAALLSLWPRRDHPPNVPEYLRGDLGLGPDYRPQNWHDIEMRARRHSRFGRADHE